MCALLHYLSNTRTFKCLVLVITSVDGRPTVFGRQNDMTSHIQPSLTELEATIQCATDNYLMHSLRSLDDLGIEFMSVNVLSTQIKVLYLQNAAGQRVIFMRPDVESNTTIAITLLINPSNLITKIRVKV